MIIYIFFNYISLTSILKILQYIKSGNLIIIHVIRYSELTTNLLLQQLIVNESGFAVGEGPSRWRVQVKWGDKLH